MVVTQCFFFFGLTFQMFASAEIIGGLFLWFTLFCKTLEVGDVAKASVSLWSTLMSQKTRDSETLYELFFFFKCDRRSGPRQHQGCNLIRLLLSFADKIFRFRFLFFVGFLNSKRDLMPLSFVLHFHCYFVPSHLLTTLQHSFSIHKASLCVH